MAADIGSLAPGMDGNVFRMAIGIMKNGGEALAIFFFFFN
jgi:hypothetical protein